MKHKKPTKGVTNLRFATLLRGQVSAEMLVLTAAIIAIAFILITQLEGTAVKSAAVLSNKTDAILQSINALD